MTGQLQNAVPWIERSLLARVPAPALLNRWEERSENEWAVLTTLQSVILAAVALVFSMMATGLAAPIPEDRRNAFFAMGTHDPSRYLLACLGATVLLSALPVVVIAFLSKVIHGDLRTKGSIALAGIIVAAETLWMLLLETQVLSESIGPVMVARGIARGILIVVVSGSLGLLFRRMATLPVNGRNWIWLRNPVFGNSPYEK